MQILKSLWPDIGVGRSIRVSAGSRYLSDRLKKKIDEYIEPLESDQEYTIYIDDNFHFMDESERYEQGTYSTYEEALAVAKGIVDEFF